MPEVSVVAFGHGQLLGGTLLAVKIRHCAPKIITEEWGNNSDVQAFTLRIASVVDAVHFVESITSVIQVSPTM